MGFGRWREKIERNAQKRQILLSAVYQWLGKSAELNFDFPAKAMTKSIVLTGATRGLGLAMTRFFAAEGHTIHGCGRDSTAIVALQKEFPHPHSFIALDISDDAAVENWAREVLNNGTPDLLLNNAAVIAPNSPLWKLPAAKVDPVIDINLKGTIHTIRHFLPAMIAQGRGVVVNFSSGWGRSTSPEVATYCATKFAIEGLTAALAQELPPGLAAVALNPGVIHTDMLASCFAASASEYPTPEEWIKTAGPFILKISPRDNGRPLTVPC
jgi:NAD(P)-dependent dehydrogenase (short-subunit alcohol dehydrogenase family)